MKVLWVNNIAIPEVAVKLGLPVSNKEGWITGMVRRLSSANEAHPVELAFAFPVPREQASMSSSVRVGSVDIRCYGFYENINSPEKVTPGLEERFREIIEDLKPDILHVFGTEYYHSCAAVQVFGRPERTLIGLQGMMKAYADAYMGGLPSAVIRRFTLRDVLRGDTLKMQQKKFYMRAENEAKALLGALNVTGRTGFDRTESLNINPSLVYHFMNETLRESFYSGSWNGNSCVPHSIFMSQGYYPIKGLHLMLEAMPSVLEAFPDAVLRVAGDDVARLYSDPSDNIAFPVEETLSEKLGGRFRRFKNRLKLSEYGLYLRRLIKKNGLENAVVVTGSLNEQEMKEEYLRANVFVCPSAIENSPNSLGEAMLLGVPCVASAVGGIPDMLDSGREGLLTPFGDANALAEAVRSIFAQSEVTRLYSLAAKKRAHMTHDPETNHRRLLEIYSRILEQ